MPDSRRVTNIEKRLGFKWEKGLSRSKRESCKVRIVKQLIDDIDELKQRWVGALPSELRRRQDFEDECLELYGDYAHRIWADPPADRSAYLVDASSNNWNGMYTCDLYISQHDNILKDLFVGLIFEKCVRFHENQKQHERRAHRSNASLEPSEIMSPLIESEEVESTLSASHSKRNTSNLITESPQISGKFSKAAADFSNPSGQPGKHASIDKSLVAPVAQMIAKPSDFSRSHYCGTAAQKQGNPELSSSYQDLTSKTDESSGSESSHTDYLNPDSDIRNRKDETWKPPARHQKAPVTLPSRKCGRDQTAAVCEAKARKRPAPGAMADIPPSKSPRKQNAVAKGSSMTKTSPQHRGASSVPSTRLKLKLKHHNTQSSPTAQSLPPQSTKTSNIGSTIEVSNMHNGQRVQMQRDKDDQEEEIQHVTQNEQQGAPPLVDRISDKTSDVAQNPPHTVQTSSRSPARKGDWSIYDVAESPVDLSPQVDAQRHQNTIEKESSAGCPESSVAGHSAASTHETSQPTSSLYNECSVASTTHQKSIPSISKETTKPQQKPQNMSASVKLDDTPDEEGSRLATAATAATVLDNRFRPAVEDELELTDTSLTETDAFCKRNARPSFPPQEAILNSPKTSGAKLRLSSSFHGDPKQQFDVNVYRKSSTDRKYLTGDIVGLQGQNHDCSPTATTDSSVKGTELKTIAITQTQLRLPENETEPLNHEQRPSDLSNMAVGARKLIFQLSTNESNQKQFVAIPFDCGIEDLCEKVQKRMNSRLGNQTIKYLMLRLPSQVSDEDPYRIEREDPDTWEEFLEVAGKEIGQKVKITADVEL